MNEHSNGTAARRDATERVRRARGLLVGGALLGSVAVAAGIGAQSVLTAQASDPTSASTGTGGVTDGTGGAARTTRGSSHSTHLVRPAHGHVAHAQSKGS